MFRIATVAVMAPVFIGVCLYGSTLLFAAFMEILLVLCFLEYTNMAKGKGIKIFRIQGLIAAIILPIAFTSLSSPVVYAVILLSLVSIIVAGFADSEKGIEGGIFTFFGVFYIALPFTAAMMMRSLPEGERLFLLVCFATWGADTGAFYAGKAFGKHLLAPKISPKKTIEGVIGGVALSIFFCLAGAMLLFDSPSALLIAAAGLTGGLIGPIGDLGESSLKRFFGAKDSGTLLPGHGGLLDRADALMITTPVFYIFLLLRDGLF